MKRFIVALPLLMSFTLTSVGYAADSVDGREAASVAQALFDAWAANSALSAQPQRPLKELFLQSPLLTTAYKEAYRKHVEAAGGISWDPIALGSVIPGCPDLHVSSVETEGDFGILVLSGVRGTATHFLTFLVLKIGGRWLIDGMTRTVHPADA